MSSLPQPDSSGTPPEPDITRQALDLLSVHADFRDETLAKLRRTEYHLVVAARRQNVSEEDIAGALRVSRTPVHATVLEAQARGDLEPPQRAQRRSRTFTAAQG